MMNRQSTSTGVVPLGAFRSDTPGCTPAALATPPGSLFAHSEHSKSVVARALVPPQQRDEANEAAAPVVSVRAPETFSRMAREHHACAVVLGPNPSEDTYDTCIRSPDKKACQY
jgi:hypothetical protein